MKRLIFFILCGTLGITMCVAQSGVNFEHLTLGEALAKAHVEKKMVFVDCYTTWCGPCKYMADNVFTQKKAGDFFNSRFVCLKMNMEEAEGKKLVEKWQVKVFPSFYMLCPDGQIQHRLVGSFGLEELIQQVSLGLNKKTSLLYLDERYDKGKMTKQEMSGYIKLLSDIYEKEKADKVSKELRASLTDKEKVRPEFWPIFSHTARKVDSPDFKFIWDNLSVFRKNIGDDKLNTFLYDVYSSALFPYLCGRTKLNPAFLKTVRERVTQLAIPRQEILELKGELAQAAFDRNIEQIIALVERLPSDLSRMELITVIAPLVLIRDAATKEQLVRIVNLGDKLIAEIKDPQIKEDQKRIFDGFRNLAHIGIYFEDLTFEQALKQAAEQKKMLFMDCYTSWCGPCKYMAENIFSQEEVGDFMNKRFVCVKYDMEKGEGPELRKKLEISAFPTFVLLNADGTVIHKTTGGGGDTKEFMERIREGLDTMRASGILEAKYMAGDRSKELLSSYLKYLIGQHISGAQKVAEELWQLLSDEEKVSEAYYFLYATDMLGTFSVEAKDYLLTHRDKFYVTIGSDVIDIRLTSDYRRTLRNIFAGVDVKTTVKDLEQMSRTLMEMKLNNEKILLANIAIARALIAGESEQLLRVCEKNVTAIPARDFFYIQLIDRMGGEMTGAQKKRWIAIGEKLIKHAVDENYKTGVEKAVKNLKNLNV